MYTFLSLYVAPMYFLMIIKVDFSQNTIIFSLPDVLPEKGD